MCSDLNKPNGQHQVLPDPDEIMNFVSGLNLRKVGGIGNVQGRVGHVAYWSLLLLLLGVGKK